MAIQRDVPAAARPLLLVATEGAESSAGALRVAGCLADARGAEVELCTVASDGAAAGRRAQMLLSAVFSHAPMWSHTVSHGELAPVLAQISHQRGAALVILGLRSGAPRASMLDVVSAVVEPVLVVPSDAADIAHRAVLATDFSRASLRAASIALDFMARPAHAAIVSAVPQQRRAALDTPVDMLLESVEDTLGRPRGVTFSRHQVDGETVSAVLRMVTADDAGLVAVGRRGRPTSPNGRGAALGRVAWGILLAASCSVLLGPSGAEPHSIQ